ncbi:outer membrane beta-barrel protein [Novosphingobium chloroacetimidivorans]|nr:outer membrane beta-barrel protein [Novosphingobium chloroacetimidivorans]
MVLTPVVATGKVAGAWWLSRRAFAQVRLPHWRAGCLIFVASAGGVAGSAWAQTVPPTGSEGAPVIGQVSVSSPLSTNGANNQPRFTLVPSIRMAYDTNILRNVDQSGSGRDNLRVTPGVDLAYSRLFGRVALKFSGSVGYDFNDRIRSLNQSRIISEGSMGAPVGAACSVKADASYRRLTFDLNDTQAAAGSTSATQVYNVSANCTRESGFNPVAGFTYRSLESSQRRVFDYRQYVGSLGVAYTQPSIGTVTLNATAAQLRRPHFAELTGFDDDTDVYTLSVGLNRSVSPRIRISAAGGLTKANPRRTGVRSFLGASYNAQVEWLPTPRLVISGAALREVTNQNGISATYVIRSNYTLSAELQLSGKSRVSLIANRSQRDFRGEDLSPSLLPIRADRSNIISARYNYDLSHRLRASFDLSHRRREADNPTYNYTSTVLSSSIGAHF